MKTCSKCKESLPLDSFNNYSRTADGKQSYCRVCQRMLLKEFRDKNGEEVDKKTWQKRKADPTHFEKRKEANRKWRENNPEKYKEIWKRSNREYKIKVLAKVSDDNIFCVNCGCDRFEFLEVNHINGGGAQENKNRGNNKKFYAAILSGERSTEDLNILCKPCNNLHYLELKFGSQPYKIIWEGQSDEQSIGVCGPASS